MSGSTAAEDAATATLEGTGSAAEARLERRLRELSTQAEELAARNAELDTFVHTVSHDLRAPLLSLEGMASLLLEAVSRGDKDETEYMVGRVRANLEHMNRLVADLLLLSRAGRLMEDPEPIDLGEAVEEALDELAPLLLPRAVAIERPREWPRVRYPRTELGQLVTNLISNAGKWAGKGGEPVVHISWRHEQDAVVLSVADNGPGVPPELRSRVFEIFRKLDPASPGTGVGLAIVKRIAERHGGQVWVEDAPRLGGASFAVTLPQA